MQPGSCRYLLLRGRLVQPFTLTHDAHSDVGPGSVHSRAGRPHAAGGGTVYVGDAEAGGQPRQTLVLTGAQAGAG